MNSEIEKVIYSSTKGYLNMCGDLDSSDLYKVVVGMTEKALIKAVLEYYDGNISKSAKVLGITRVTLRKKLLEISDK